MAQRLSEAQRQRYHDEGLLFPLDAFSSEEVTQYRAASDALEARLGGKPRTVEVRQMHLHFPWACALALHPRVLDAVEDVLGPDLLVWATELFSKHPWDEGVSIGWHQDRPYMGFESGSTTTAWIALADSLPANGCMRAIPSPERRQAGQIRTGTGTAVHEEQAVDVILSAGQMSLHDIDIVHGSGPNRSELKRIGFVVRYITPEARPLQGCPPVLVARGHDRQGHFCPVDPPSETDAEEALARMRASAAEHLEAMLQNLKKVHT